MAMLLGFGAVHLSAQVPRRVVPPPALRAQEMANVHEEPDLLALERNTEVQIKGSLGEGADIDLSMTGIGFDFLNNVMLENGDFLTCKVKVSKANRGYVVTWTISRQLKIETSRGNEPAMTTYEFRDFSSTGNVACLDGKPVRILRNGEHSLLLTVREANDAAPVDPAE